MTTPDLKPASMRPGIQRFERNHAGRDLVVGDLHGCFGALQKALREARFDETRDRLFAVGDLVDRGPSSGEVDDWVAKPWFHPVRGNHDQMAIGIVHGRHDIARYVQNGGGWFLELSAARRGEIAAALDTLPLGIEIDHEVGRVGIVHAEVPERDWDGFADALRNATSNAVFRGVEEQALWSRERIETQDRTPVAGAALVFVGHSVVPVAGALGNVVYVDTGAGYGRAPTVTDIAAWKHVAIAGRRRRP